MRRRFAIYAVFVFFVCAYATLGRVPRSTLQVLRGGAEHVLRTGSPSVEISPQA